MPRDRVTSLCLFTCIALFALGGAFVVLRVPFPTPYDELQHVSFITAMRNAPRLFPRYGDYFVLRGDLSAWSDVRNYLAHPPLYYLLLAPFDGNVPVLRIINLAMATTGFALCATAGVSLLSTTNQRVAFVALLLVFTKPALIAGMVNNDNLVLLETGLMFWLLTQCHKVHNDRHPEEPASQAPDAAAVGRSILVAILLALVGWTKFNAFVGLTLFVGLLHLFDVITRREKFFGLASVLLLCGVLVGAVPTFANLVSFGMPAYVPVDFLFVEPSMRPSYDPGAFIAAFWHKVGQKVFYIDGLVDLMPVVIATGSLALCAGLAKPTRARSIALSASIAMIAFAGLHTFYGWNSFRTLGTMSDAQSRYYVMLWPGFALAAVLGASAIAALTNERKQSQNGKRLPGLLRYLRASQSR